MSASEGAVVRASRAPATEGPERRYCGAKRTRGEGTCTRPAGWGTDHPGYGSCKFHAGSTPNGRAAARVMQARDSLERLGVPLTLTGVNPIHLIEELVDQSAAIVTYLREQVGALPAVLSEDGTHPLVRLYGVERDRAARVAREAVALGLEERRVRIDEATTARVIQAVVGALEEHADRIPPDVLPSVRTSIGRRLRAGAP